MDEFPVALGNGDEVIAFDIGGTWFRSTLLTREGRLTGAQRVPSMNCRSLPGKSAAEIVDEIAAYIANTVNSFWQSPFLAGRQPAIAVSMGAALNAHTGKILGSGPILGEDSTSFDLGRTIRRHLPDVSITIVNDVTASLIAHSRLPNFRSARRLALLTVSTGIASRVLHCSVPHVPVDPTLGVQGEIGHHRVAFSVNGHAMSLKCDCGGTDHLNAFASGQGIKRVLDRMREIFPHEFRVSDLNSGDPANGSLQALADGLANGDPLSRKVLQAVTMPVADAIKWHFMLDPEIDKLILTGGVCFLLRDFYLSAVIENLKASEFYPLTSDGESFWADRVILGPHSDDAGLVGAAYMARESPTLHRRETLNSTPPYRVSRQNAIEYPIEVVPNIFQNADFPRSLLEPFDRIVLVADAPVEEIHGDEIRELLSAAHRRVDTIILHASEKQKDLFSFMEVVSSFEKLGVRRREDLVVVAGGGVALDIVGFAASVYRRGIPYMRLPTTLVAQIDTGIGVKTGINFRQSKSRLGTFSAPYAVVVDPCFLSTISDRQIRNGLSEALKIALVADRPLFELIEEHAFSLVRTKLQCEQGTQIIRRAIRAMLLELSPNLHERTLERRPDYGHTFSPIFEFELSDLEHGEAVALDMAIATALAVVSDFLDIEDAEQILATQQALGLPTMRAGLTIDMLLRGIHDAKKHRGGQLRMPVLCGIGEAMFVDEISEVRLEEALAFIQSWSSGGRKKSRYTA
jgi:3-dehydroquinate synthetase/predicted NBD/HSP70 family sugar kinase